MIIRIWFAIEKKFELMKRLLFTAGGSPGQEGIYRYLEKKYDYILLI